MLFQIYVNYSLFLVEVRQPYEVIISTITVFIYLMIVLYLANVNRMCHKWKVFLKLLKNLLLNFDISIFST